MLFTLIKSQDQNATEISFSDVSWKDWGWGFFCFCVGGATGHMGHILQAVSILSTSFGETFLSGMTLSPIIGIAVPFMSPFLVIMLDLISPPRNICEERIRARAFYISLGATLLGLVASIFYQIYYFGFDTVFLSSDVLNGVCYWRAPSG